MTKQNRRSDPSEPIQFSVVVELVEAGPGEALKFIEIVDAESESGAIEYVENLYDRILTISAHETTEAERLLKNEIDQLNQYIWDHDDVNVPF